MVPRDSRSFLDISIQVMKTHWWSSRASPNEMILLDSSEAFQWFTVNGNCQGFSEDLEGLALEEMMRIRDQLFTVNTFDE